jgi:hypothetical protein
MALGTCNAALLKWTRSFLLALHLTMFMACILLCSLPLSLECNVYHALALLVSSELRSV